VTRNGAIHEPFRRRIARARQAMLGRGLAALIVSQPFDIQYLSGFDGTFGSIVLEMDQSIFITDGRYVEAVAKSLAGWKVLGVPRGNPGDWHSQFWKGLAAKHIGFDGRAEWLQVCAWRRQARPGRLVEAGDIVANLRVIKEPGEMAAIRIAVRLADELMARTIAFLKPGVREIDVARFIRRGVEDLEADSESFANLVAAGPNASQPHHHPGGRRLRAGDAVFIDLGVRWKGYCSDITRTVFIGRCSERARRVYEAVLRAEEAGLAAVRPGVRAADVDAAARGVLEKAGFAQYFLHGTGHGVGLEIHEAPTLNSRSKEVLEEGMCVTVEPGVYIPGEIGVRIEDFVRVGPRGAQILSAHPKELTIL